MWRNCNVFCGQIKPKNTTYCLYQGEHLAILVFAEIFGWFKPTWVKWSVVEILWNKSLCFWRNSAESRAESCVDGKAVWLLSRKPGVTTVAVSLSLDHFTDILQLINQWERDCTTCSIEITDIDRLTQTGSYTASFRLTFINIIGLFIRKIWTNISI